MNEAVTEHIFNMRLSCTYTDPDNTVASLGVELLGKDGWETFELGTGTAGFLIFVYAVFNCQHMYMRLNCAERGLMLESASGTIEMQADRDWVVRKLAIGFEGRLKSGVPAAADIDYIIERMKQCPVSTNIRDVPDSHSALELHEPR